jgi:serine/threonine protein kinase
MHGANSSFVNKLENDFEDDTYYYLVMELAHHGDLFALLDKLR